MREGLHLGVPQTKEITGKGGGEASPCLRICGVSTQINIFLYRGVGMGGQGGRTTPPFWGQILYICYIISVRAEISAKITLLKINI